MDQNLDDPLTRSFQIKSQKEEMTVKLSPSHPSKKMENDSLYKTKHTDQKTTDKVDPFIILAEKHLSNSELDMAYEVVCKVYSHTKQKEKILEKLSEEYFNNGELDKALKVVGDISDRETKDKFFEKVAEKYFNDGNLDKALKVINEIISDRSAKEKFLAKLAEKHFVNDELDKALKVIGEISSEREIKEKFLEKLAEKHFSHGDLDNALKVIGEIKTGNANKDSFLVKIFESYFSKGNLNVQNIIAVIYQISNQEKIDDLLATSLERCYKRNETEELKQLIEGIFLKALIKKIFNEMKKNSKCLPLIKSLSRKSYQRNWQNNMNLKF